nr:nitrite reductase [Candidatus Pantoea persica]
MVCGSGKTRLGCVLVGDSGDYSTLLQMMLNQMALPDAPESLIPPALAGAPSKALPEQRSSAAATTSARATSAWR